MKLKYVNNTIKELNYKNNLNYEGQGELTQRHNIQLNIGADKAREVLYLEVNSDIEVLMEDNQVVKDVEITALFFFNIEAEEGDDLNNGDIYKKELKKELPLYLKMFDDILKRATNLDFSGPISVINEDFDIESLIKE